MQTNPLVAEIIQLAATHKKISIYLANTEKHLTITAVSADHTDVLLATTWAGDTVVINPANVLYAVPMK